MKRSISLLLKVHKKIIFYRKNLFWVHLIDFLERVIRFIRNKYKYILSVIQYFLQKLKKKKEDKHMDIFFD